MKIIEWIKKKLGFDENDFDDIELGTSDNAESLMESLARASKKRRLIDINDREQRDQYVRECCEMMATTSKDVEAQKIEYQQVTMRIADLDEIESLPVFDRTKVRAGAKKIVNLEKEDSSYVRPMSKITEVQYRAMERQAKEIPDAIAKLKKDEEYQMKVRRDLNLLEGEKGAIAYQRKEERSKAKNARSFAIITLFAACMAALLLWILKDAMKLDVSLGYVVLAGVFAIILTAVFVMFQNAQMGITKTNRQLNRTITLQNSVKIRYVNITNVLDYNYAKYNVMNAYELSYLWDKYQEEKAAREHDSEMSEKMDEARRELYALLKTYHISDPALWVCQPGVLAFDEDIKEVRKTLTVQRQRLKKGIDFEIYSLEETKAELQSLIREYPKYAKEILGIVDCYDG